MSVRLSIRLVEWDGMGGSDCGAFQRISENEMFKLVVVFLCK